MINDLISYYKTIVKRVSFWLPLCLLVLIGYGFSAANPTVGIDDLARDIYIGEGQAMLSATRWGMNVWIKLLSTFEFIPGIDHLIGVILMICAGIMYSFLFYSLSDNKQYSLKYAVCSCLFVTFPIINEIWEYSGANFIVAGNMFIVASILSYMEYHQHLNWKTIIICGIPLSLVASSYETGIFIYIYSVLMILFYKYCVLNKEQNKNGWFSDGVSYIPVLTTSVLIRVVIGVFIVKILGLTYRVNGGAFFDLDLWDFLYNGVLYIVNCLVYEPIAIFIIMLIIFFIYSIMLCRKIKDILPIILFVLIALSLFGQAILVVGEMPYRTAHTLMVFNGFCGFLFMEFMENKFDKKVYLIAFCTLMFLSYRQALYLDTLLTLNHVRSENEARVASQIGYTLKSQYDVKPVLFVGDYSLGEYLDNNINVGYTDWNDRLYRLIRNFENPSEEYRVIQTNVKSNFSWSKKAFGSQRMMKAYFSYLGFDIELVDNFSEDLYDQNLEKAKSYNMKPYEIRDEGEYLLVCLGDL